MLTGRPGQRRRPVVAFAVTAKLAAITVLAAMTAVGLASGPPAAAQGVAGIARAAELPMLRAIDVPQAWRLTRGKGVIVGVLDTGADPSVPDLAGSVTTGPDYIAGVDPRGYRPPHLHGTYIASIIAGHGSGPGRTEGIVGVAPQASILSIRVIVDKQEPGLLPFARNARYRDSIAKGIRYAVGHGVGVINMSLGTIVPTPAMREAVGYAISRGVVVVASAGNSGAGHGRFTPYSYPAAFTGVISVGAVNTSGRRASFSDHNSSVLVSAPGVNVPGAGPGGEYIIGSGTSPASAFVAGVAALIKAKYPRLAPALVAQAIIGSTKRRPTGGYNTSVGFGEVDARGALAEAAQLASRPPAAGLRPAAHFGGGAPKPIAVTHRDYRLATALLVIAIVAAIGFGLATTGLARRSLRWKRQGAGPPAIELARPESVVPESAGPGSAWAGSAQPQSTPSEFAEPDPPTPLPPGATAPAALAPPERKAIDDLRGS